MSENDKESIKSKLELELGEWQTKLDEAKVQLHLGAADTKDKLEPHIEQLENELHSAKLKIQSIDDATSDAWESIKEGFDHSVKTMDGALAKAKSHFKD